MGKSERLLLLEQELKRLVPTMAQASKIILDEGVSKYPVFVTHQDEMHIGLPIVEKEKVGGIWNVNASTLEELVAKKVVHDDKVDAFREQYKDPEAHVCIFVLSELGAKFVYLPI